jgi:hypothetical protein
MAKHRVVLDMTTDLVHFKEGQCTHGNKPFPDVVAIPVLSWASRLASFHDSRSYSSGVCLPGSAVSTLFVCFPKFSGRHLVVFCMDHAILRVVDFILVHCAYREAPFWVAAFALSLASVRGSLSLLDRSHPTLIVFPSRRNALIDS